MIIFLGGLLAVSKFMPNIEAKSVVLELTTRDRWIPPTKASDTELWCFLCSALEQTAEQTIETLVIWDAIALIMTPL